MTTTSFIFIHTYIFVYLKVLKHNFRHKNIRYSDYGNENLLMMCVKKVNNKLCGSRHNMPPPCHLDLWPWKWCPSHVWRGLPLCQF